MPRDAKSLVLVCVDTDVPTRADVARLHTKLDVIQSSLVNLSLKVDRLLADREREARRQSRGRTGGATSE